MKTYFIALICILLLFIFLGGFFVLKTFFIKPEGKIYTITITDKGFTPPTLHIKQYDTIQFKTKLKDDFWPASDLHPTHGIYPDFDPLEPIEATNIWTFQFEKVGKWNFHNHLDPWQRGTIYVVK